PPTLGVSPSAPRLGAIVPRAAERARPSGDAQSTDHSLSEIESFGKFACPLPVKGLRLPYDMTEIHQRNGLSTLVFMMRGSRDRPQSFQCRFGLSSKTPRRRT